MATGADKDMVGTSASDPANLTVGHGVCVLPALRRLVPVNRNKRVSGIGTPYHRSLPSAAIDKCSTHDLLT